MSKKILGCVNSEQNEQDELDREYIKRIKSGDNIALNYIMDKYKNFVFANGADITCAGFVLTDIELLTVFAVLPMFKGVSFPNRCFRNFFGITAGKNRQKNYKNRDKFYLQKKHPLLKFYNNITNLKSQQIFLKGIKKPFLRLQIFFRKDRFFSHIKLTEPLG